MQRVEPVASLHCINRQYKEDSGQLSNTALLNPKLQMVKGTTPAFPAGSAPPTAGVAHGATREVTEGETNLPGQSQVAKTRKHLDAQSYRTHWLARTPEHCWREGSLVSLWQLHKSRTTSKNNLVTATITSRLAHQGMCLTLWNLPPNFTPHHPNHRDQAEGR